MTDLAGYYDQSYPASIWEQPTPPTGVTAGTPGSFTPAGSDVPANLAALQALGALGQTTAWATGQYVVLGDASNAHWNGTAWIAGIAAAAEEPIFAAIPVEESTDEPSEE